MAELTSEHVIKAHDDWRAWGKQFGWRLYGVNYDPDAASFFLPSNDIIEVTKEARSGIDSAFASNKQPQG